MNCLFIAIPPCTVGKPQSLKIPKRERTKSYEWSYITTAT